MGHWSKLLTVSVISAILIFGGIPFASADGPADFGDAPDGTATGYPGGLAQTGAFPSLNANSGAHVHTTSLVSLGPTNSAESDAQLTNLDGSDDGPVHMGLVLTSIPPPAKLTFEATSSVTATYYLNVLIDLNQDGEWGGVGAGGELEHVVDDQEVDLVPGINSITTADFAFSSGNVLPFPSWMRVSLTSTPIATANWDGTGSFTAGEIEDHLVGSPFNSKGPIPIPGITCLPFKKAIAAFSCNTPNFGVAGDVKWTMTRVNGGVTITSPAANIASTNTALFGTIVNLPPNPPPGQALGAFNPVGDSSDTPSLWKVTIAPVDPPTFFDGQILYPEVGNFETEFEFVSDEDSDGDNVFDNADPLTGVVTDGFAAGCCTFGGIDDRDGNTGIDISESPSGGIRIITPTGGNIDFASFDLCGGMILAGQDSFSGTTTVDYECLPNGTGYTMNVIAGLATAALSQRDGTIVFSESSAGFPAGTCLSYDTANDQFDNCGSSSYSLDCELPSPVVVPVSTPTTTGCGFDYLFGGGVTNPSIDESIVDGMDSDCFNSGTLSGCVDTYGDPLSIVPGFLTGNPNSVFIHTRNGCIPDCSLDDQRTFLEFGAGPDLFLDIPPQTEVEVAHTNSGTLGTWEVFIFSSDGPIFSELHATGNIQWVTEMPDLELQSAEVFWDLDNRDTSLSCDSPGTARVSVSGPYSFVAELQACDSYHSFIPSEGVTTSSTGPGLWSNLSLWETEPHIYDSVVLFDNFNLDEDYGNRIIDSLNVMSGATLTIDPGQTLTIESLGEGNNFGTIINNGNLVVDGIFNNLGGGVIQNNGIININFVGTLENSGTISNNSGGEINIGGTLNNNCGALLTDNGGTINGSVNDLSVPSSGDWTITGLPCLLVGDATAPANVIVPSGTNLRIPSGVTLDIDFTQFNLTVESGGGVLIESGGTIT